MGGVVDTISGGIFGGNKKQKVTTDVAPAGQEETQLLQQLLASAGGQAGQQAPGQLDPQAQKIQDLFKGVLTNYLSGAQSGQVASPEVLKQTQAFVDQTFTNPAQKSLDVQAQNFIAQQAQRSAVAGRQSTDPAVAARVYGQLAPLQAQIGMQRGQMIQDTAINQPLRQLQAGLQGLGGLSQIQNQQAFAPMFMNTLNQQAMQNRLGLLNYMSNQRLGAAGKTMSDTTGRGLVGLVGFNSPFADQFVQAAGAAGKAGG